jgi:hypothetical protein
VDATTVSVRPAALVIEAVSLTVEFAIVSEVVAFVNGVPKDAVTPLSVSVPVPPSVPEFWLNAPLLIVNAASIDPIHRESDYQELLQTIVRVKHGRHFFNPAGNSFG